MARRTAGGVDGPRVGDAGLLVSGLAKSGFQVIQFMLLFVVPQILLSGLFDLSSAPEWMQVLGQCFPITYGVDALRAVMPRGADFASVGIDLAVIWGFIALFFVLAALKFCKKRARRQEGRSGAGTRRRSRGTPMAGWAAFGSWEPLTERRMRSGSVLRPGDLSKKT